MTKAADAKIGDKEECNICHVMLTCGLTAPSGNYPQKNQWQLNGESHYIFKAGQNMTCKGFIVEDPKNRHDSSTPRPGETAYAPKEAISPEVLRTDTFIDFNKIYSEGWNKAKELAKSVTFGNELDEPTLLLLTQRIMRDYIVFYSARNL